MDGAVFDLIRRARNGGAEALCAFDLIELDGEDLRRVPIEYRKHKLTRLVRTPRPGIVVNEHYDGDGEIVSSTPASLAVKASCRSGLARPIARDAHRIG